MDEQRHRTTAVDISSMDNILDTTATPLRRASMTGKRPNILPYSNFLAFGKKKKGSKANSGEKEVRYNFKG